MSGQHVTEATDAAVWAADQGAVAASRAKVYVRPRTPSTSPCGDGSRSHRVSRTAILPPARRPGAVPSQADGTIVLKNSGNYDPDGSAWETTGSAVPVNAANTRLSVSFSGEPNRDEPGNY